MKKVFIAAVLAIFLLPMIGTASEKQNDYTRNVNVKSDRKKSRRIVIENIPHIRQKGAYCVPATCAMVLRYFDKRYDQKDMGEIFNSSKKTGTNINNIFRAFQTTDLAEDFNIKNIYKLTNQEVYQLKQAYASAFTKLAEDKKKFKTFNKLKRAKKKPLNNARSDTLYNMDPLLALKTFPYCRKNLRKALESTCKDYINAACCKKCECALAHFVVKCAHKNYGRDRK